PGSAEDGISHRWRKSHDRRLPGAGRRSIFAVNNLDLDLRHIPKTWNPVFTETGIQDFPILEMDSLKQRSTNALHQRSRHLVAQAVGIDDCSTIKSCSHANDLHRLSRVVNGYFGTGCNVAAFFDSSGQAEPAFFGRTLLA